MTPEEPTPLSAGQIGPFLRSTIRSGERLTMADVDDIERAVAARATVPAGPDMDRMRAAFGEHVVGHMACDVDCFDEIGRRYARLAAEGAARPVPAVEPHQVAAFASYLREAERDAVPAVDEDRERPEAAYLAASLAAIESVAEKIGDIELFSELTIAVEDIRDAIHLRAGVSTGAATPDRHLDFCAGGEFCSLDDCLCECHVEVVGTRPSTGAATPDRERLAALSAAASRGSWHIAIAVGDSRAGVVDDAGRDVVGFRATRENAEFIVALVNSFRASTGAATPDRERLREALVFIADWARDCAHPEDTASGYGFATIEKMARAALAPVETPRPEGDR